MSPVETITRTEFGQRVAEILSVEQRAAIDRLHALVEESWHDGCAAANESATCCVNEILEARWALT